MRLYKFIKEYNLFNLFKSAKKLIDIGFLQIFSSTTINQIVNFAYGILIIRLIPKSNFGMYSYAHTIFQTFMIFSGFGIASAILQIASENAGNSLKIAQLTQFGLFFGLAFNIIISIGILLMSLFIQLPIKSSNYLLGLHFLLPFLIFIKDVQKKALRVEFKNKEFAQANMIDTILIACGAIFGALIFQEKGVIYGQYFASVITVVLFLKFYHTPSVIKNVELSRREKREMLQIAGMTTLNDGLTHMFSLVSTFLLGIIIADENIIASYKAATVIPMALNFLPVALITFVYPYFAKNRANKSWVIKNYKLYILFAGCGFFIIAFVGILTASSVIRLVFSADYVDIAVAYRILMIGFFFSGTFRMIAINLLYTQRKLKTILFLNVTGALVNILLSLFLIPKYQISGAALSYTFSMIIMGVIATFAFINSVRRISVVI